MKHFIRSITPEVANQIWDIIVETCGANDHPDSWDRQSFVNFASADEATQKDRGSWTEWRFCGSFGFGGKVWNNGDFYVTCYKEEETRANLKRVQAANARLSALYLQYVQSLGG